MAMVYQQRPEQFDPLNDFERLSVSGPFNEKKAIQSSESLYNDDQGEPSLSSANSTPAGPPPAYTRRANNVAQQSAEQQQRPRLQQHQEPSIASMPFGEERANQAMMQFNSPFATDADWRPTRSFDARLSKLPSLPFEMRLKQRFAGKPSDASTRPCFQRPCMEMPPASFRPIICKGKGQLATDGFENLYPGQTFAPRDVSAADWHAFMQDVQAAGKLSGGQEVVATIAPITMHMGATGYFVTKAIKKGMSKKKQPAIFEAIELWNQEFFQPRGFDVYMCNKDAQRVTACSVNADVPFAGDTGLPMQYTDQMQQQQTAQGNGYDDPSCQLGGRRGGGRRERRQVRRERRYGGGDGRQRNVFMVIAPAMSEDRRRASEGCVYDQA